MPDFLPDTYRDAADLEAVLRRHEGNGSSFAASQLLEDDEQERLPDAAMAVLQDWGVAEFLIPVVDGGRWHSVEQLLALLRTISRRDLTLGFALGPCVLAALPVWIAGTPGQKARAAALVRGSGLSLAGTERAHGSDLLACRTRADAGADGYCLTGEKWLISNAERAAGWVVFARTRPAGGPRGFSLLLLEKARLDPSRWALLPRVQTLGLRGGDLSGFRLRGCPVLPDALIGPEGSGFALLHRTLTVTRTLCAGLALGATDTALRLVADFALRRRLYGAPAIELPHVRRVLAGAFAELLLLESVTTVAARSVQAGISPVFVSALAKYVVPTVAERLVRDLAEVLGARFFLRDGHPWALFQKVQRDLAIVSVFEGNTAVNLSLIAARLVRQGDEPAPADRTDGSETLFRLDLPQPPLDPSQLGLDRDGPDPAIDGLGWAAARLDELRRHSPGKDAPMLDVLADATKRLAEAVRDCQAAIAAHRSRWSGKAGAVPPALLGLTSRYCALHAAAAGLLLWLHNRERLGGFFRRGNWLALALHRVLAADDPCAEPSATWEDDVINELGARLRRKASFGIIPLGDRPIDANQEANHEADLVPG
jgi:alkylation response protein AidB-like acyl-CoA dehydrogenase